MIFILKKIIAPLFLPLPLCLTALLIGLYLLWFTRKQKVGKIIVTGGVVLLALFSYGLFTNSLLKSLESKFPPLIDLREVSDVKWVVVLGRGHISDPRLPVTGQISNSGLARLVEGIRIHKRLPQSRLILSGGAVFDPVSEAKAMADVATLLGVNRRDMLLETVSKDTKDQARNIKTITENNQFILVTSAAHMLRSMFLFRKLGMRPVAAPVDYEIKELQGIHPGSFFPNSGGLRKMELAFHEYLGILWAKIRKQI